MTTSDATSPETWFLGVDTARRGIYLELFSPCHSQVFSRRAPEARGEQLATELEALFRESEISLKSIPEIVVARGPGSFTGLRAGI
ncbi:MAG TPA: hypothetical protein VLM37_13055, partial [Fibrobacteraceae bacterium]|nr:hypothetical protein [Fibrobacteraceae bacterium]